MKKKFYSFGTYEEKGAVEIETQVDFPSNTHIPFDSEMRTNNVFKIAKGKFFFDLAGFVDSSAHFAISKRFKQLLEENHIKGWTCFPIIIKGSDQEYFVFQPKSIAGEILNLREINNYTEKNRRFDLNTWDGSEIFTLKNTLIFACTEEVKQLIEKAGITNIDFQDYSTIKSS